MAVEALFHSFDLVLSLQQSKILALLAAEVRIDLVLGRKTKLFHGREFLFPARHVPDLLTLRLGSLHDGANTRFLRVVQVQTLGHLSQMRLHLFS